MLDILTRCCAGGGPSSTADEPLAAEQEKHIPFTFETSNSGGVKEYVYPNLFEEADEMLTVALLIYTITDLRSLAKEEDNKLVTPERILTLPLSLKTALEMIEENIDEIKQSIGDEDHEVTMAALKSLQDRFEHQSAQNGGGGHKWFNPFAQLNGSVETTLVESPTTSMTGGPVLTAYGDNKPDRELVYAIGVHPARKRITVAFRGSVTPTDFLTDAGIALNEQPNPVVCSKNADAGGADSEEDELSETICIHHGFYEYLFKPNKESGISKYDEIVEHVNKLFDEDPDHKSNYKLYVTGHSLGGALATLFAFQTAAKLSDPTYDGPIPGPISCVSVASPRVGELSFQSAFRHLEKSGHLRHLRIVNESDPVTVLPKSSAKQLLAMISPAAFIAYSAYKKGNKKFSDRETYRHTGMKLKLKKDAPLEIAYSGAATAVEEKVESEEEEGDGKEKKKKPSLVSSLHTSVKKMNLPNVKCHYGDTYCTRLASAKENLVGLTLNELYQSKAGLNAKVC